MTRQIENVWIAALLNHFIIAFIANIMSITNFNVPYLNEDIWYFSQETTLKMRHTLYKHSFVLMVYYVYY